MKRRIFTMLVALVCAMTAFSQQGNFTIQNVSSKQVESNDTSVYRISLECEVNGIQNLNDLEIYFSTEQGTDNLGFHIFHVYKHAGEYYINVYNTSYVISGNKIQIEFQITQQQKEMGNYIKVTGLGKDRKLTNNVSYKMDN